MVNVKERVDEDDSDNAPLRLLQKTAQKHKEPTSQPKAQVGTAPTTKVRCMNAVSGDAWRTLICFSLITFTLMFAILA